MGKNTTQTQKPELICPECGSNTIVKNGHHRARTGMTQQYQCTKCGRYFRKYVEKLGDQNEGK